MIELIIYWLGVYLSLYIFFDSYVNEKITKRDVYLSFILALFSWFNFVIVLFVFMVKFVRSKLK